MADSKQFTVILVLSLFIHCRTQLVVNVKNREGDTTQQKISANKDNDQVTLDYHLLDGSYAAMVVDFPKKLQVFKSVVLGELELGQKPSESMCFILFFDGNDFIPSDAMAKLRQKNPQTVRVAEEDLGQENFYMDHEIVQTKASVFGPIVQKTCLDVNRVYTTAESIKLIAKGNETFLSELTKVSVNITNVNKPKRCVNVTHNWEECLCEHFVCIEWYPCALKYCQGQNDRGKIINYRCGIRSCSKCRVFYFKVDYKHQCFWEANMQSET